MPTLFLALISYCIGSLPVGWLIGRARGVDLFKTGSGNIGATNVSRVLGRKFGVLVFLLDLLKGMVPVLLGEDETQKVTAGASAFLGHLFPVFLRFRGGKGVATGVGTVLLLATIPALLALIVWVLLLLATRFVSLASIVAVLTLALTQCILCDRPFSPITVYCLAGAALVVAKHRKNITRLLNGTESKTGDGPMRHNSLKVLHVLAVGLWFGGAGFFNLAVAPSLNRTYKSVVDSAPNDRTAFQPVGIAKPTEESRKALASALFGAGVGPVFPVYFLMMSLCGITALATSFAWRELGGVHRLRFRVATLALLTVVLGWPLSDYVADLRLERLSLNAEAAAAATQAFATWHLVSLALSFITILLAGWLLILAAWLPQKNQGDAGNC